MATASELLDRLEVLIEQMAAEVEESEEKSRRLLAEFSSFRRRAEIDKEGAERLGSDKAVRQLAELVDDCDRALSALPDDAPDLIRDGLLHLRKTTLERFASLGYRPLGERGDKFDPTLHEALSLEYVRGPDDRLVSVFRLGWQRDDGVVISPALVSVSRNDYVCPFGIKDCFGDCPGCTAEEGL